MRKRTKERKMNKGTEEKKDIYLYEEESCTICVVYCTIIYIFRPINFSLMFSPYTKYGIQR